MRCPHCIITTYSLAASKSPDSGVEIMAAPVAGKAFAALRTPPCAQQPHHEGCVLEEVMVWPLATTGLHPGNGQRSLTHLNEDSVKPDDLRYTAGPLSSQSPATSYCVFPPFYRLCFLAAGSPVSEAVISQETSIFQHTGRTWLNKHDSPAWQKGVSWRCFRCRVWEECLPCPVALIQGICPGWVSCRCAAGLCS